MMTTVMECQIRPNNATVTDWAKIDRLGLLGTANDRLGRNG